jgi:SEC-C motif
MEWARRNGLRGSYGTGSWDGSWYPVLDHAGRWYAPIAVWTSGTVEIQFYRLKAKPPFDNPATLHEYAQRPPGFRENRIIEHASHHVFSELKPNDPARADLGPYDPCWCGSGKKLKFCHGK